MVGFKFAQRYRNYNAGEIAGYPQHIAEAMQAKKLGTIVKEAPAPVSASTLVKNTPKNIVTK